MALRLPDHWLWEFWFARDGDDGEQLLFTWLMDGDQGRFVGELSDPVPL